MGDVGLFLSGATLFLNSLMLFGKADGKSVGVFNLFVGALQVIIPFYLLAISDQNHWTIFNLACVFLFGFTYLYVGIISLKGLEGNGLGWFSLWVAIIAIVYAAVSAIHFHDMVNAITWVMWAYLWFLFFLSMALNKKIDAYIGKVAFVQSWVTLTIPALLSMTGVWKTAFVSHLWLYVLILSIGYFIICTIRLKAPFNRKEKNTDAQLIV
ncbi:AmiS/UreI family transporter [Peribacillus tepidiphilus]|jgi:putative amide transporter protein|uniref:AmiS/UreI family transporter n=1 Tax=Peribacillus tepidiphilus TaxID=2652445 RepID=UPI0035B56497